MNVLLGIIQAAFPAKRPSGERDVPPHAGPESPESGLAPSPSPALQRQGLNLHENTKHFLAGDARSREPLRFGPVFSRPPPRLGRRRHRPKGLLPPPRFHRPRARPATQARLGGRFWGTQETQSCSRRSRVWLAESGTLRPPASPPDARKPRGPEETMSETAPEAPAAAAPATKAPAAKKAKKPAVAAKPRKAAGPSVTELLTKAVAASKERNGVSLAALKKALAAAGYDVEKNNSRIKLGLKSLVGKGTLVQTKGTGASGSFKLNKKQQEGKDKAPVKKKPAVKSKKPAAKKPAAAKKALKKPAAKKSPKKAVKKPAAGAKKAAKSPKKAKPAKPKKAVKSPAKAKTKAAKPKTPKAKVAKPKKGAAKKK
ncbi:histone H1-like [Crotalus adamanteus]|uniref:Histone H1-like n=1 Tax=Crotalus adamanteus TaxID=8729 RepID=A0AAW1B5Y6_CROAD